MFVDSHCHLDRIIEHDPNLDVATVLASAKQSQVSHFLCVAVSVQSFSQMMSQITPFENVFATCGVHPLHQDEQATYDELVSSASDKKVVAIGETGLDFHYAPETKSVQLDSFEMHIAAAKALNKPLVIHTRQAREETIALFKSTDAGSVGGVLHCFTEDWDMAKRAIDLGFYISISGIVTFRNAEQLREVTRKLPLDRLLIETDAPWLAPVPYRGKTNQPAYVSRVGQFVADLKGLNVEQLAQATTDNFFELFPLAQR